MKEGVRTKHAKDTTMNIIILKNLRNTHKTAIFRNKFLHHVLLNNSNLSPATSISHKSFSNFVFIIIAAVDSNQTLRATFCPNDDNIIYTIQILFFYVRRNPTNLIYDPYHVLKYSLYCLPYGAATICV